MTTATAYAAHTRATYARALADVAAADTAYAAARAAALAAATLAAAAAADTCRLRLLVAVAKCRDAADATRAADEATSRAAND